MFGGAFFPFCFFGPLKLFAHSFGDATARSVMSKRGIKTKHTVGPSEMTLPVFEIQKRQFARIFNLWNLILFYNIFTFFEYFNSFKRNKK